MSVRALVMTAPGINCDRETVQAAALAGATVEPVHVRALVERKRSLCDYDLLIIPGGFSYGDHLGAGSLLATTLRHHLLADLEAFIDEGRPVLGICNGFQVLSRLGFLGELALAPNEPAGFQCRWVRLRVVESSCLFLQGLEEIELPIAHGEGRVWAGSRVNAPLRYTENPNGSVDGIAGASDARGNVFGLMPHPERYVTPYQHPHWRRDVSLPPLGLTLFQNAVRAAGGRA